MNLEGLQHLSSSARALADDCEVIVLGSASLLASFPELGDPGKPLATTFDADFCPEPFDEVTGNMLNEALGQEGSFHLRHGYHADILRPDIFETLPQSWRDRLVPVPGAERVFALEPHDLVATKIFIGRGKDLKLGKWLIEHDLVESELVKERFRSIKKSERSIRRSAEAFREVFGEGPL